MKRLISTLFILLLPLLVASCGGTSTQTAAATDPAAVASSTVDLLVKGDFAAAESRFDPAMKEGLPKEKLAEAWQAVTAQYGAFKRQLSAQRGKAQGYDVVGVKCEFEKGPLVIRFALNSDRQIAGLYFDAAQQQQQQQQQ